MRIQSLLLILTVFIVFASFTSAECCLDTTGYCTEEDSCTTSGYELIDEGSCVGLESCQIGCCDDDNEGEIPDYLTSQYNCEGTFDNSITTDAVCTYPQELGCCILGSGNLWMSNLDCFNQEGTGLVLNQEECIQEEIVHTISGTVFDETNQPVENVQVFITEGITTIVQGTDSDGTYSFEEAEDGTTYYLTANYQSCTASESVTISESDVEVNLTLNCETIGCSELSAELGYSSSTCCSSGETGTLEGISGVALEATCTDEINQICWGNSDTCEIITYEEGDSCLGEDSEITLTAEEMENQRAVSLNWIVEGCENGEFDVIRCITSTELECNPFEGADYITTERISATYYPDYIIGEEAKNYCYGVIGYYDLGETTTSLESNYACVPFDERECNLPGESQCTGATTYDSCTDSYTIEETTCEQGNVCVDNYETNTASCIEQAPCGLCNGPLGIFLNENKLVDGIRCNELDTCFIDYTPIVVDNYRQCLEVNTCYDYRSKDSCQGENGIDSCNRGPCQWMETSTEEIGVGVCRPIQEIKQDCSKCTDMTFNKFFGTCNQERCSMMGKCFLGESEDCIDLDTVNCNFFNNQELCINSANYLSLEGENKLNQSVQISVTYATDENGELDPEQRIGGTHEVLTNADSHFGSLPGFNLCKWFGNTCGKDADGDFNEDNNANDMTPPVTNLILVNEENIILPKELNIPIVITDNKATSGFNTYFSFAKEQQYQEEEEEENVVAKEQQAEYYYNYSYPIIEVENNSITTEEINESGNYRIYYYTEDNANNLEIVKHINAVVDAEMLMPNITWSFAMTESENSTLIINLEVYEKVWCSDYLYDSETEGLEELIAENLQTTELDIGTYTLTMEVADGSYWHILNCQDVVHNTGTVETGIGINAPIPILITIE